MMPVLAQPSGKLSFQANGKRYISSSDHARCYTMLDSKKGYLNASDKEQMLIELEWPNLIKAGEYKANFSTGIKCMVILDYTNYILLSPDDYFSLTIQEIKKEGHWLLLSGRFTAKLTNNKGASVHLTNGSFATYRLQ